MNMGKLFHTKGRFCHDIYRLRHKRFLPPAPRRIHQVFPDVHGRMEHHTQQPSFMARFARQQKISLKQSVRPPAPQCRRLEIELRSPRHFAHVLKDLLTTFAASRQGSRTSSLERTARSRNLPRRAPLPRPPLHHAAGIQLDRPLRSGGLRPHQPNLPPHPLLPSDHLRGWSEQNNRSIVYRSI